MSVPTKYAAIMMHVIVDSANKFVYNKAKRGKEGEREGGGGL